MKSVVILCLLSLAVAAYAAPTITSGAVGYLNLVITTHGNGSQVTVDPAGVCSAEQQFEYKDGYIQLKSNPNLVLDVKDSVGANGTPVILWVKKSPPALNQLWTIYGDRIESQLAPGYNLYKSSSGSGVVISNNSPTEKFQFVNSPYPCPVTCTSSGDPHFTCWSGKKFDFQSANTVLLAQFSGTKIFAVQFSCAPGVTCNQGIIVQPAGTTESLQLTFAQAYYNKVATTLHVGTNTFSPFISVVRLSNTQYTINVPGGSVSYTNYGTSVSLGVTITSGTPQPSLCYCPTLSTTPTTTTATVADGYNDVLLKKVRRVVGGVVSGSKHAQVNMPPPAHEFGTQFVVKNANDTNYQYVVTPFVYDPTYTPNYGPYTTNDKGLIQTATQLCSVLLPNGPYKGCAAFVEAGDFYDMCYNDTIATNSTKASLQNIDAYAKLCAEAAQRNGSTIVLPTSGASSIAYGAGLGVNGTVWQGGRVMFTIQAKDATFANRTTGGDNFTVTASGPVAVAFSVVDNKNGTYFVSYTPTQTGRYNISVKLNGYDDVSGSPFNVTVASGTTSAAASIAYGDGVTNPIPSGVYVTFTIQARTSTGEDRVTGGDKFTVTFAGGVFQLISLTDNNDGTYTVTYIAYAVGTFTMNVTMQGTHIQKSPFTLIVK